jgi:hypothetical protein
MRDCLGIAILGTLGDIGVEKKQPSNPIRRPGIVCEQLREETLPDEGPVARQRRD